ncbi:hypothetical protein JW711_02705 [Candidatus Woesearchaeota archaeon]|nr:hypothetical protein [Candidatus Woesearchaeota archaeon]
MEPHYNLTRTSSLKIPTGGRLPIQTFGSILPQIMEAARAQGADPILFYKGIAQEERKLLQQQRSYMR